MRVLPVTFLVSAVVAAAVPITPAAAAASAAPRAAGIRLFARASAPKAMPARVPAGADGVGRRPHGFAARNEPRPGPIGGGFGGRRRLEGAGFGGQARRHGSRVFSPVIGTGDPEGFGSPDELASRPDYRERYVGPVEYPPPGFPIGFAPADGRGPSFRTLHPGPRIITIGAPAPWLKGRPLPRVVYGWTPNGRLD